MATVPHNQHYSFPPRPSQVIVHNHPICRSVSNQRIN